MNKYLKKTSTGTKHFKGKKYRPIVNIVKVKNGLPTVLEISGLRYTLQHNDQYSVTQNKKKKRK